MHVRKRSFLGVRVAIGSVKHLLQCSPLARGNLPHLAGAQDSVGPIPARAGQPRPREMGAAVCRAYPRSRGATPTTRSASSPGMGLSPLARGNHSGANKAACRFGPIPARAGQPRLHAQPQAPAWAYPRSRGATFAVVVGVRLAQGLSPLARGNPPRPCFRRRLSGPIPARAGQPTTYWVPPGVSRAYPRSRGATVFAPLNDGLVQGLSPLARGNRLGEGFTLPRIRPIPARAGQPPCAVHGCGLRRAYPRSRGATFRCHVARLFWRGLSPLARGNRARH